jgi:hypothetical protein
MELRTLKFLEFAAIFGAIAWYWFLQRSATSPPTAPDKANETAEPNERSTSQGRQSAGLRGGGSSRWARRATSARGDSAGGSGPRRLSRTQQHGEARLSGLTPFGAIVTYHHRSGSLRSSTKRLPSLEM